MYRSSLKYVLCLVLLIVFMTGCASGAKQENASPASTAPTASEPASTPAEASTSVPTTTPTSTPTPVPEALAEYVLLAPKSAPILPALVMRENAPEWKNLKIETWDTLDQVLVHLQKNTAQFFAVPINMAAQLASKGLPLQLIHVSTWGTLYLVSTDPGVLSFSDLQGEKLFIAQKGGPPEVLTKHFLKLDNLEGKIDLAYAAPPEIAQLLASGQIKHAVLPEPVLSGVRMKLGDKLHEVISYQQLWMDTYHQELPQVGVVVNREWAKANPQVVEAFQQAYSAAAASVLASPDEAAALAEPVTGLKAPILKSSLSKLNLEVVPALEARSAIERYYGVLLESHPEAIGGKLPDDSFYYQP